MNHKPNGKLLAFASFMGAPALLKQPTKHVESRPYA